MPLVTPPSATALKTGMPGVNGCGKTHGHRYQSPTVTDGCLGVVGDVMDLLNLMEFHGHMSSIVYRCNMFPGWHFEM